MGSAFVANAAKFFEQLFGVKVHMFNEAPDHHEHAAYIENLNKLLRDMIERAELRGDVRSRDDLELLCALYMVRANMLMVRFMTTPFKITYGQPSRTPISCAEQSPAIVPPEVDPSSMHFLRTLMAQINDLLDDRLMRRESVVRSALLSGDARDHAQQASRREFRPGQIVSYNGQKWTVLDTAGHTVDTPIRARLQRATHAGVELKTALITEIDELPDTRTELHLPQKKTDLHVGKFVFIEAIQDVIEAGLVTAVKDDAVTVHVYLPSPKFNAYQPTWELPNGKVEKRKRPLDGSKPYTIPVDRSQVIATGTWTDGKISENLTKFLSR
jgi:hypothetical protein